MELAEEVSWLKKQLSDNPEVYYLFLEKFFKMYQREKGNVKFCIKVMPEQLIWLHCVQC